MLRSVVPRNCNTLCRLSEIEPLPVWAVVVARWLVGLVVLALEAIALELVPSEGSGLVRTGLEVLDQEWIGLVSTVRPWCLGIAIWTMRSEFLSDAKGEQRRKLSLTL